MQNMRPLPGFGAGAGTIPECCRNDALDANVPARPRVDGPGARTEPGNQGEQWNSQPAR
jgi:hypothetical protein